MPQFSQGTEADLQNVKTRGNNAAAREPYRQVLREMTDGQVLVVTPDEGESLRAIKLRLAKAAKEVDRAIKYNDSADGQTLIVQAVAPSEVKPSRPRRGKQNAETADIELEATPA